MWPGNAGASLIGQSAIGWQRTSVNGAGDSSFSVLQTLVIPSGMMGPNSSIVIYTDWLYPNSASTKVLSVDFGGSNLVSLTQTTAVSCSIVTRVLSLNSLGSQSTFNSINFGLGATNSRIQTSIDTTANVNIDIKTRWGAAANAETITLVGYSVWHYPGS